MKKYNESHNAHLFGIITRHGHTHGRRVHKPARKDEVTRSRWYGNYGIFRYSLRMAATYERGGRSEADYFCDVYNSAQMIDPLTQGALIRKLVLRNKK
jgi:hypothetical protein